MRLTQLCGRQPRFSGSIFTVRVGTCHCSITLLSCPSVSPCVRDLSKCFLGTLSLVPLLGGETEAQEESKWLGLDPGCLLKGMLTCSTLLFLSFT